MQGIDKFIQFVTATEGRIFAFWVFMIFPMISTGVTFIQGEFEYSFRSAIVTMVMLSGFYIVAQFDRKV